MKTMEPFAHGGSIAAAARQLGLPVGALLDFSASINPLGMPEGVLRAARESLPGAIHYPEADAASLIEALAEYHGMASEHFLPGSGSTELFYLFPRVLRPRRALLVVPAFSEYERGLYHAGVPIDLLPLRAEEGFRLDPERLLKSLTPDIELVILANPGNPTAGGIDAEEVKRIVRGVREQALVAVDEAFVDFCPERSVLESIPEHGNLYVFRSLTKFYAIPGLRAGYLAGPPAGIGRLAAAKEPWCLSVPSVAAAIACLGQENYRRRSRETVAALRQQLAAALEQLGLEVFPSAANFLLLRLPSDGTTAAEMAAALRTEEGILVRDCANFASLDERYMRVAVRRDEENQRLLTALARLLRREPAGVGRDSAGSV